jgi:uncharacterized phiE125 gp8 family phage protein
VEVTLITDVVTEPVSLTLAKSYAKIDDTAAEADLMPVLLASARELCEEYTQKSFAPKTYEVVLSYQEYRERPRLPYGPNITIISVFDQDGVEVTDTLFLSDAYYAEYLKGASISNDWQDDRPTFGGDVYSGPLANNYYTIRYEGGFASGKLPKKAQTALMATFMELYNNRGNSIVGATIQDLPQSAKELLDSMRDKVVF